MLQVRVLSPLQIQSPWYTSCMHYTKPKLVNIVILLGVVAIVLGVIWRMWQPDTTRMAADLERINFSSQQYRDLLEQSKVASQTHQDISQLKRYLAINDLDERVTKIKYHDPDQALKNSRTDYTTLRTNNIHFIDGPNVGNPRMECKNTADQLEKIELFTTLTNQLVSGGGYARTAYLCGDEYVVSQFYDPRGVEWVGPFTLK